MALGTRTHVFIFEILMKFAWPFITITIARIMFYLSLFLFSFKEQAKSWLNFLRLQSIRTWQEMQVKFLKKSFLNHKTNTVKRQITNFAVKDS